MGGTEIKNEAPSEQAVREEFLGKFRVEEEITKRKIVEMQAELELEKQRTEQDNLKCRRARDKLRETIVIESSEILKKQLDLCLRIVEMESKKLDIVNTKLTTANTLLGKDRVDLAIQMITEARTLETQLLSTNEVLDRISEHLSIDTSKFQALIDEGREIGVIEQ